MVADRGELDGDRCDVGGVEALAVVAVVVSRVVRMQFPCRVAPEYRPGSCSGIVRRFGEGGHMGDKSSDATVVAVTASVTATAGLSVKVATRHNMATQHLWTARHLARLLYSPGLKSENRAKEEAGTLNPGCHLGSSMR
jgi:hypothetical protein